METHAHIQVRQVSASFTKSFRRCRQVSLAVLAGVGRCHKTLRQVLAPGMDPSASEEVDSSRTVYEEPLCGLAGLRVETLHRTVE